MESSDPAFRLPYGPDFLFIDRVVDLSRPDRIVTQTHFQASARILRSHFSKGPTVVPGVLLIEMASQSALLCGQLLGLVPEGSLLLLGNVKAMFLRMAPGDAWVTAHVKIDNPAGGFFYKCELFCEDDLICKVQGTGVFAPDLRLPDPQGAG